MCKVVYKDLLCVWVESMVNSWIFLVGHIYIIRFMKAIFDRIKFVFSSFVYKFMISDSCRGWLVYSSPLKQQEAQTYDRVYFTGTRTCVTGIINCENKIIAFFKEENVWFLIL